MCNLGIAYINGIGTKACPELGVYWFKKASEGEIISAKFNLGYCYEVGIGTNKDIPAAINLYSSAARDGHVESSVRLGELYMNEESVKDYQSAIYWLNLAMEKGNKKAYELLAVIYGSEAYYDEDKLNYIKEMIG
jgi:TPR repeat protein